MSGTLGEHHHPIRESGAIISPSDLELPATQPIDITALMAAPDQIVLAAASAEVSDDNPAARGRRGPTEIPQALQRWDSDGGAAATATRPSPESTADATTDLGDVA